MSLHETVSEDKLFQTRPMAAGQRTAETGECGKLYMLKLQHKVDLILTLAFLVITLDI